MSKLNLNIDTNDTVVLVNSNKTTTAQILQQLFKSLAGGARLKNTTVVAGATPVAAAGTATVDDATVTGTVGLIINGITVSVASGTDTGYVVAQALATAINASSNALVENFGTAVATNPSGDDGLVTYTANIKYGVAGNAITFAATGTGVAVTSGARLTGGSNGTVTSFSY